MHASYPAMKYFYYKDNPLIKGHIYDKLNALKSLNLDLIYKISSYFHIKGRNSVVVWQN